MRKIYIILIFMISLSFVLSSAGCVSSDPVVGDWYFAAMHYELNDDGTGTFDYILSWDNRAYCPLKWENLGNNEYSITVFYPDHSRIFFEESALLSGDGNTITLTIGNLTFNDNKD